MEQVKSRSLVGRTIIEAIVIFTFAYLYYGILAAKEWTWMFVSGDSGDWLAASTIWMVPQPYGSPLYILLGQSINTISNNLVIDMTYLLSVIPAAITIALVYLIIKQLGYSTKFAVLGASSLIACSIFLSQATVLEEYAITTMFIAAAFFTYVRGNKLLTILFLGFGAAVHVIVFAIAVLWIIVTWKEWKGIKIKASLVLFFSGVVPYSLILILMALDTPRFIAGDLSLQSINAYLGSTGTIGKICAATMANCNRYLIIEED